MADTLGGRLKLYRKKIGMNQKQFAAKLGISQGSLCDIENGKTEPSAQTLTSISENTHMNLRWLLTGRVDR
jgi:transcriptional regulator with XRE-family HTH domain